MKINQCENNSSSYPSWICGECAFKNEGKWPEGHFSTFHVGVCGWCDEKKDVSSPRSWGYPIYLGD